MKSKPANVKGRIRQLESLVVDLMNQQKQTQAVSDTTTTPTERSGSIASETAKPGPYTELTPPSDNEAALQYTNGLQGAASPDCGVEKPFGHMSISKNDEISYHGASHWETILSSISDLKNELGDDDEGGEQLTGEEALETADDSSKDSPTDQTQPSHSAQIPLLVGNPVRVTKEDLINAMPEKRVADRLLSLWFNSPDPFKPIIHAPTFQEEYKQYWKDPKRTPVMWLGLTFAILSLAESFALRDADYTSTAATACRERVYKYRSLAASATVLSDFTTPKRYTIECLVFYTAGLVGNDGFMKVWLMTGLVLRLCLRMGYHRDPSFYRNISAFDGEIRRRVWTCVSMIDIMISFQLGLPSMVTTIITDTEPPRNLLDRDFNPSTKVLPPGRSADELTPASYARTKVGIVRIFAQAAELGHSTAPVKHEDVMRLDGELEVACDSMPALLKMPDISELVTDPPEQLMCRTNLALLVHKTRIILHRNLMLIPLSQLSEEEQVRGIGTSKMICTESALNVLQLHHTIHAETQPGGKLYSVKWYMGSISTHDFLLAAMVVCLVLSQQMSEDEQLRLTGSQLWCPRRQAMTEALERSYEIWNSGSATKQSQSGLSYCREKDATASTSGETHKASRAMAVMLDRVKTHFQGRPEDPSTCGTQPPSVPAHLQNSMQQNANMPFHGVVSNVPWTGEVPDQPSNENGLVSGGPPNMPRSTVSQDPTPAGNASGFDFSAIGDMIDGPVPMDWGYWDDQILQQNTQQVNAGGDVDASGTRMFAGGQNHNSFGMEGSAMASDATIPMMQTNLSDLQFNWQDLQDVDLDIRDYGSGGLWGASPHWQT